jgi:hypothetical protein
MTQKMKRLLAVVLACALLLGTTAVAASAIDTSAAEEQLVILPKIVSPKGYDGLIISGTNLYSFTVPWSGKWHILSNSWGVYPSWRAWSDTLTQYAGLDDTSTIFKVLTALADLPNYLLNFLLNVLLDKYFPSTDPVVTLYDEAGKKIADYDNEGFPLFKHNDGDYRAVVELEKGKTYYLATGANATTWDLPYITKITPCLIP